MLSEIGSNFWIYPEELKNKNCLITPAQFGCEGSDYAWMSTGRSATSFVLDTIENRNPNVRKVAIIPPFTCHTVIEPFLAKGYKVFTFHIGQDMEATSDDILKVVKERNASVVLFHRYFGFNTIKDIDSIIPKLRDSGIIVIEDCTQNLYSGYQKSDADFFVGSIRKWCGVPDGGFAVCREGKFENKPEVLDKKLQEAKKSASLMKYEYIFEGKGHKQSFLMKYREAEDILDSQTQYYAICELSTSIQSNLNVEELKYKRRENYRFIAEGLSNIKGIKVIKPHIQIDETPLYCPILCDNRSEVQALLVKQSIFAPVVWPKADCCPMIDDDADSLYEHILCIPIDQRYDIDDMKRIISVFQNTLYKEEIETKWLTWDEILPFKEQIIDMELDSMINYHYPDWNIPRSYPEERVNRLKQHLESGNTFFWAAFKGRKLFGYYWGYASQFIDKKRWNTRSIYFLPEVKGFGFGSKAIEEAHKKAIEIGCDEAATEYVPWNKPMAQMLEKYGYMPSRIEVVKKLK